MSTLLLGDPHQHFQTCRIVVVFSGDFGFTGRLPHSEITYSQQAAFHHVGRIFVGRHVNPGGR